MANPDNACHATYNSDAELLKSHQASPQNNMGLYNLHCKWRTAFVFFLRIRLMILSAGPMQWSWTRWKGIVDLKYVHGQGDCVTNFHMMHHSWNIVMSEYEKCYQMHLDGIDRSSKLTLLSLQNAEAYPSHQYVEPDLNFVPVLHETHPGSRYLLFPPYQLHFMILSMHLAYLAWCTFTGV